MAYRLSRYILSLFEISRIGTSQDQLDIIGYGYWGTHWAMTSGYPGSKSVPATALLITTWAIQIYICGYNISCHKHHNLFQDSLADYHYHALYQCLY